MGQALAAKQAGLATALFECMPAFPLSHACIVTDLTPTVMIDLRVRLPLCEAPCGLPRERAWSRLLLLADGMMVSQVYDWFDVHVASPPCDSAL